MTGSAGIALLVVGALVYGGFAINRSATVVDQTQALTEVTDPVARLCAEDPSVRPRLGLACDTAAQVVRGERGRTGASGEDGRDGVDGRAGVDGRPGAVGSPGVDGEPGEAGEPGAAGEDGARGATGQEGPRGRDGADGADGRDGEDGAPGRDGATGPAGPPGPTCPGGTSLQPVTFASGESGLGCVTESEGP